MTKARLKISEEDNKSLKWEHEVLEQRFEKVKTMSWVQCYITLSPCILVGKQYYM